MLAIQLATALTEIHQQRNVHGSLHPALILIATNPTQTPSIDQVRILERGQAPTLDLTSQLSYAAPEQTGRLNWPIDQRTDLYTVGIILYQLFTGRLPFIIDEPLRLLHAQIATPPTSPVLLSPQLPAPISAIYVPESAVAHEVTARFCLSNGQRGYAEHHLRQAHRCYQQWGALGKVRQIEQQFPQLLPAIPSAEPAPRTELSVYLDMAGVLKVTHILSGEATLAQLLDTLTTILVENAGAQAGTLLLPNAGRWCWTSPISTNACSG